MESNKEKNRKLLQKINALEHNLSQNTIKKRRKISALIEGEGAYRKSLARVYISSTYEKLSAAVVKPAVVTAASVSHVMMAGNHGFVPNPIMPGFSAIAMNHHQSDDLLKSTVTQRQVKGKWKVVVQGRLIIPHLDHLSAKLMDDEDGKSDDRHLRESEEEERSDPIKFAHFFDALQITTKAGEKLNWKREVESEDTYAFSIVLDDFYAGSSEVPIQIEIHARVPENSEYLPSSALVKALFPRMSKIVPVTMAQVYDNLFSYILRHRLQDPSDLSIINNNENLSLLFGCKRMLFSAVGELISSRKLLTPIDSEHLVHPTKFCFNLRRNNAANLVEEDLEVFVPVLFHEKARDMLRRIKRRELEYTSSRSKAHKMLSSSNTEDEHIKASIERCVNLENSTPQLSDIPTFLALAKAAPENSEAREIAHLDARLLFLQNRIFAHTNLAREKRQITDIILGRTKHSYNDVTK